jgi:hypothetical protein
MIPRIKPEGMLFGKPVSTPGSSPGAGFFRIMRWVRCHLPRVRRAEESSPTEGRRGSRYGAEILVTSLRGRRGAHSLLSHAARRKAKKTRALRRFDRLIEISADFSIQTINFQPH